VRTRSEAPAAAADRGDLVHRGDHAVHPRPRRAARAAPPRRRPRRRSVPTPRPLPRRRKGGQHRHREQRGASPAPLGRARSPPGASPSPRGVHRQQLHPERGGGAHGVRHGVRDVVQLQVEKDAAVAGDQRPHKRRPFGDEELQTHLHDPARVGDPLQQCPGAVRVGYVEREDGDRRTDGAPWRGPGLRRWHPGAGEPGHAQRAVAGGGPGASEEVADRVRQLRGRSGPGARRLPRSRSSVGLEMKPSSTSTDGMNAPFSTTKPACFTPRLGPGCAFGQPTLDHLGPVADSSRRYLFWRRSCMMKLSGSSFCGGFSYCCAAFSISRQRARRRCVPRRGSTSRSRVRERWVGVAVDRDEERGLTFAPAPAVRHARAVGERDQRVAIAGHPDLHGGILTQDGSRAAGEASVTSFSRVPGGADRPGVHPAVSGVDHHQPARRRPGLRRGAAAPGAAAASGVGPPCGSGSRGAA
jgi:hypothetical protein